MNSSNDTPAPDQMTARERDTLLAVSRKRERVAKTELRVLATERLAQVEALLSAQFAAEDKQWAALVDQAREVVARANDEITRICAEAGVPESFAPGLRIGWCPRGETAFAPRRAELRLAARTRIAADEAVGKATIERRTLEIQTALLAGSLTSEAAQLALEGMASVDALLPEVAVEELHALVDRQKREQQQHHDDELARLMASYRR